MTGKDRTGQQEKTVSRKDRKRTYTGQDAAFAVALPQRADDAQAFAIIGGAAGDGRGVVLEEEIVQMHDAAQHHRLLLGLQRLVLLGEGELVQINVGTEGQAGFPAANGGTLVDLANVARLSGARRDLEHISAAHTLPARKATWALHHAKGLLARAGLGGGEIEGGCEPGPLLGHHGAAEVVAALLGGSDGPIEVTQVHVHVVLALGATNEASEPLGAAAFALQRHDWAGGMVDLHDN